MPPFFDPFSSFFVFCSLLVVYHYVMSDSSRPHGLQPTRLLCAEDVLSNNTGMACHFLTQGIFPIQGSNPRLLHGQADSLPLSHQGSLLLLAYLHYCFFLFISLFSNPYLGSLYLLCTRQIPPWCCHLNSHLRLCLYQLML